MQSKLTKLAVAAVAVAGAFASLPAHAGALAMSDLNITQLYLAAPNGTPLPSNASINVLGESRTATAGANYNGVSGAGTSVTSFTIGGTADPTAVCVGPDCGTIGGSLYSAGGGIQNNSLDHIAPPPSASYALGDALIAGSAIGGAVTGLTRSDASAIGPTNFGGSNATLLNTATLESTFAVSTSFSGQLAVTGDAYFKLWSQITGTESTQASAGMGWIVSITCVDGASTDCTTFNGGNSSFTFAPSQFNFASTVSGTNSRDHSFAGTVVSSTMLNFIAGNTYELAVNQSTNATVRSLPEPASMALVGLSLLGVGFAGYRRNKKA